MFGFIYKTTCLINNKIYIGQHIRNVDSYIGSGSYIKKAIIKYGKENFKREILKFCNNQKELDKWEQIYILKFDSTNPNIGYNILPGTANKFGSGSPSKIKSVAERISKSQLSYWKNNEEARLKRSELSRNMRHSEETKRKIGEKSKLIVHSEETKNKIRIANLGENNPNFNGKTMTEDVKIRIKNTMIEKTSSLEYRKLMSERAKESWKKRKMK